MKLYINSAVNIPREGIFWYIHGELVAFSDQIDIHNPLGSEPILHKEVWSHIKSQYKVDGCEVPFDYFPRGRVIVYPVKDPITGVFSFSCSVYCDTCILKNTNVHDMIESEFRLYLKNCDIDYVGQMSIDGTHYTCHNCR